VAIPGKKLGGSEKRRIWVIIRVGAQAIVIWVVKGGVYLCSWRAPHFGGGRLDEKKINTKRPSQNLCPVLRKIKVFHVEAF